VLTNSKTSSKYVVGRFANAQFPANIAIQRIVIKVQGESTPEHAEGRTDFEYKHQRSMSNKNCNYILDAYGKSTRLRPSPPHLSYVYMDYAGFGDLQQLMERHRM
jgi:hypothetical protein